MNPMQLNFWNSTFIYQNNSSRLNITYDTNFIKLSLVMLKW